MLSFDTVYAGLIVGTCPKNEEDVCSLNRHNVSTVICLQSDHDFVANDIDWGTMQQHYAKAGIRAVRVAMTDFDEDNIASLLSKAATVVDDAMAATGNVYLHCTAGRERSPTVAAAWIMLFRETSAMDACEIVNAARPSNPYIHMLQTLDMAR